MTPTSAPGDPTAPTNQPTREASDEGPPGTSTDVRSPDDALTPHPGRSMPWPPTEHQRGLASPYPPGGVDPDPDAGRRQDRFYMRLLIAMVLIIVVGGFVVSFIGLVLGFTGSAS